MKKQNLKSWSKPARNLLIALGVAAIPAYAITTGPMAHKRTNTPKLANATIGRYLYVGPAPRFQAEDLEIYVSKIALTARVKAWVPSEMPGQYEKILLQRWKKIYDAFQNPSMHLENIQSNSELASATRDAGNKAWLKIASQYMKHFLDDSGVDIYSASASESEYRDRILLAILREYTQDSTISLSRGVELVNRLNDPSFAASRREHSEALFEHHLGKLFTKDDSRPGRSVGYLTFVYPIAATTDGPFSQPAEGLIPFGIEGNIDARWWSDKWKDEFGGMPFIMINPAGVAFHGPITNKSGLDVWYLRRGYVSHGCHRMDSSDVIELRNILPTDLETLSKQKRNIKYVEMEWPDVTDVNGDGNLEAIDVAYYEVPTSVTVKEGLSIEQAAASYMLPDAQKRYWTKQFTQFDNRLSGGNRFDVVEGKFYGIPKYEVQGKKLVRSGRLDGIPIKTFEYRGNRLVQYREDGTRPSGYDDTSGKFPPNYFNAR